MNKEIIITTAFEVPGRKILKVIGIARGNTVRARNLGRDIGAGLKNLIGGEIKTYSEMTSQSRDEAFNRMVNHAIKMGADAIIGMAFSTSMVMQGASEMLAYGTAVKLK
ncbi:MAG: YbjQ family protein [Nanoarchaeota archaeon]